MTTRTHEHEDRALCERLRKARTGLMLDHERIANRIDTLHAQRADLLERLDQSEQREHNLRVELVRARHEFLVVISRATTARNYIETTINANRAEAIADATNWPVQGLE